MSHRPRPSKVALSENVQAGRLTWAEAFKALGIDPGWLYRHLVWTDLCNTVLPRTEQRHIAQTLAKKGKRSWRSKKTKMLSQELRGDPRALKQQAWNTIKVWWAPVLARGKLHLELLGEGFPGETPEGAAILAGKVRSALNKRFQTGPAPTTLFVDRGQGFWRITNGKITPEFQEALRKSSLKTFYGDDA